MATKKQKKTDSYKVGKGTDNINVSVAVGTGQLASVKMSLDKELVLRAPAPVALQNLGPGSDLKGTLLIVETTVTDASLQSNKLTVVIKLTGGASSKTITTPGEVVDDGDSIIFETFVLLKE